MRGAPGLLCVGVRWDSVPPPARSGAPGTRVTESRLSPDGVLGPLSNIIALYGHFCYGGFVVSFFCVGFGVGFGAGVGVYRSLCDAQN